MIQAIGFDFDGVLVESVDIKTRAYASLFEDKGPEVVRQVIDYHLAHSGISRFEKFRTIHSDILKQKLSDKRFQFLCDRFSKIVVDAVVAAPWVAGAREFLERNFRGYRMFVVSGTPESELREIVERRGMTRFFEAVRGSPKDKVTLLAEVENDLNLVREKTVYVGDAKTDWDASRALGLTFLWRRSPEGTQYLEKFSGSPMIDLNQLEARLNQVVTSGPVDLASPAENENIRP